MITAELPTTIWVSCLCNSAMDRAAGNPPDRPHAPSACSMAASTSFSSYTSSRIHLAAPARGAARSGSCRIVCRAARPCCLPACPPLCSCPSIPSTSISSSISESSKWWEATRGPAAPGSRPRTKPGGARSLDAWEGESYSGIGDGAGGPCAPKPGSERPAEVAKVRLCAEACLPPTPAGTCAKLLLPPPPSCAPPATCLALPRCRPAGYITCCCSWFAAVHAFASASLSRASARRIRPTLLPATLPLPLCTLHTSASSSPSPAAGLR
mmetsp:Transcript_28640/g.63040  ORF Transcript_28640/g.63040 Transcript_28640/m.63040 type:complete len:268 (-) Transcript_28640:28-831(-)